MSPCRRATTGTGAELDFAFSGGPLHSVLPSGVGRSVSRGAVVSMRAVPCCCLVAAEAALLRGVRRKEGGVWASCGEPFEELMVLTCHQYQA